MSLACNCLSLPLPQTKIPKIGVIGGYFLIRVCRYKMGGYPVPFGPSVPEFNRRLEGFHRFSDVTGLQLPFPSSAPNQNPQNRRNRRLFFDSCVQVQDGWVSGTFWALG